MVTTGAAGTEMVAKKAVLQVNAVTIGAAKNWTFKFGYTIHKEPVCGTTIQRVIHGVFDGDCECEEVYVSDDNFKALVANQDTTYTIVSTDSDVSSATKVCTMVVKLSEFERRGPPNADGVIRAMLKGTMTAFPT
jgi:hypothetical protein